MSGNNGSSLRLLFFLYAGKLFKILTFLEVFIKIIPIIFIFRLHVEFCDWNLCGKKEDLERNFDLKVVVFFEK